MHDTDPWPDTLGPVDNSLIPVRFSRRDPSKTIPLCWAEDLLMDWFAAAPASAGNKLAEVVKRWSLAQYGQNGSDEGQ